MRFCDPRNLVHSAPTRSRPRAPPSVLGARGMRAVAPGGESPPHHDRALQHALRYPCDRRGMHNEHLGSTLAGHRCAHSEPRSNPQGSRIR